MVILKRQWGAFYGTDLDLQLRRRGLSTIVMCGIATEIGVESTARDAYERGYELVFASDAMTGSTAEGHANSIERIFPRMGRVRTTAADSGRIGERSGELGREEEALFRSADLPVGCRARRPRPRAPIFPHTALVPRPASKAVSMRATLLILLAAPPRDRCVRESENPHPSE